MKNLLLSLSITFFLAACSSTPENPNKEQPQYSAPKIDLHLQQALEYEQYPDQDELAELMTSKLTEAMKEKGLMAGEGDASALSIAITMKYQRVFAGEATPIPSSSVAPPNVAYSVVVSRSGNPVGSLERSNITVNRGFASNLQGTFTLGLGNSPETEVQDIATLAKGIANDLAAMDIAGR